MIEHTQVRCGCCDKYLPAAEWNAHKREHLHDVNAAATILNDPRIKAIDTVIGILGGINAR